MSKPRILIVDDERDVVDFIEQALRAEDFEVVKAYDGLSALDAAEMEMPDLILLDIMMPMMSGYEVAEQLRANPQTQSTPILFLTSAHNVEARARTRQLGVAGVIFKPIPPAELIAQVRRYLPEKKETY